MLLATDCPSFSNPFLSVVAFLLDQGCHVCLIKVLWLPSLPQCRVSLISSSADLMSPFSYAIFLHSSCSVNLLLAFLQTHRPVFSHSHASTGAVLMLVCLGAAFFNYIFYSFVLDHCTELSEVTLFFFPSMYKTI